jgi:hypothetical protein
MAKKKKKVTAAKRARVKDKKSSKRVHKVLKRFNPK